MNKYEIANEVSFTDFQTFMNKDSADKAFVWADLFSKLCEIVKMTLMAVKDKINRSDRKYTFEIFGYDFIIDKEFNPYLLEINTNPDIEESSPIYKLIVPRMVDDALRLTVDKVFDTKFTNNMNSAKYMSPFPVKGYSEEENLWAHICNVKDNRNENFLENFSKSPPKK